VPDTDAQPVTADADETSGVREHEGKPFGHRSAAHDL
jgi:hypothetical protein